MQYIFNIKLHSIISLVFLTVVILFPQLSFMAICALTVFTHPPHLLNNHNVPLRCFYSFECLFEARISSSKRFSIWLCSGLCSLLQL